MASVGIRGLRHLMLRPWTFNIASSVSWIELGPVFNVTARSENFRLDVGPNHLLAVEALQRHLREKLPEFFAETSRPQKSAEPASTSTAVQNIARFLSPTTFGGTDDKNDQHYVDDLRAGAFQYIEASSTDNMKPYQVRSLARVLQHIYGVFLKSHYPETSIVLGKLI